MSKKIYLCGQITGLSYEEARFGWREQVHTLLTPLGITCWSPLRGFDHLEHVTEWSHMGEGGHVMSTPRGLTSRDRFDVHRSDLIFCNLIGMEKISVGSMLEFGWADALNIPILCCMEEGNIHEHAMVCDLINWRCTTLEEGIEVARRIFSEGL